MKAFAPPAGGRSLFSAASERQLLHGLRDLVALHEGPSQVLRGLTAMMPARHGANHAHGHAHHRQRRTGVPNARAGRRSKRFLLNKAPIALAQFGEAKADVTETLDKL